MTTQVQAAHKNCALPANPISNVIVSTTKDWTQVRAFSKSKLGHVDIILEQKMGRMSIKDMRQTDDSIQELFIIAKDQAGLHRILNLFQQSAGRLDVSTADMRYAQIMLRNAEIRKQVEEFVNCVIDDNKK